MSDARPKLDLSNLPLDSFYIGGAWHKASSDKTIAVISPISKSAIAHVADASESDVDAAVDAASKAFEDGAWSGLSFKERAEWLRKLSAEIAKHTDQLALVWTEQIGVPYQGAIAMTGFFSTGLESYAAIGDEFEPVVEKQSFMAENSYLVHEPVGVVAAIAPWNVPLWTMLNKIGPAMLAGCTVVMKPAPETPLEAYIVAQCADAIGLPAGVFNVINAGRDGSDYLVRQEAVDKISFTGSVPTGKRIASVCAERIGRCTLELGGKSAAIILNDYDLEEAATAVAAEITGLAGQNCAALTRVLIGKDRHDEFVEILKAKCEAMVIGGAYDENATLGSLSTERQLERVEALIAQAVKEGSQIVTGGKRPEGIEGGWFMEPTIFANVDNSTMVAQEEFFGPVLAVIPFDDVDHAIAIANDSKFGLSGAVFTHDNDAARKVARKVRTGTMAQNGAKSDFGIGFGGFKQSGLGREGGLQGLHGFLENKTMFLD